MFFIYIFGYWGIVNLLTYALFRADKRNAKRHLWRIPESVLLFCSFVGGAAGALLAMYRFHHKTKHKKFTILVPMFLILQIAWALYMIMK